MDIGAPSGHKEDGSIDFCHTQVFFVHTHQVFEEVSRLKKVDDAHDRLRIQATLK
jgi:hypothetical protein